MEEVLARIERDFPGYQWLVRSVNEDDEYNHDGPYFAHLFDPAAGMGHCGYLVSFHSDGDSPARALMAVYESAQASKS